MIAAAAATILLVMKKPGNVRVMQQTLARSGYTGKMISGVAELQATLAEPLSPRLGIVDVTDFGSNGRQIHTIYTCLQERSIPFVVLSAPQALDLGNHSFAYGATNVLPKPIAKSALLQLIHGLAA
ncbi:MAG: response regulator [Nitrococcus mobilis]|nr:response regulator [Nitrococcus mobilis]